jgi:hypothetical protein
MSKGLTYAGYSLQNDSKTGMHERILAEAYKEPMIQHRQDFDRFFNEDSSRA